MDNERRADLGADAVLAAARQTNVHIADSTHTAIVDVLAYVAHFCDRCGLDPEQTFYSALESYAGDFEDGPKAAQELLAEVPLDDQVL